MKMRDLSESQKDLRMEMVTGMEELMISFHDGARIQSWFTVGTATEER